MTGKHGVTIEPIIGELGRYYTYSLSNKREPDNKYITEFSKGKWSCGCSDYMTRCVPNYKSQKQNIPYGNPNRTECKHIDAVKALVEEITKHLDDY